MATTAVYAVIRALFEGLGGTGVLPADVALYDGFPTSERYAAEFLLIGVEDPQVQSAASSATASQDWAHVTGTQRDEEGEIVCAASSWNGNADPQLARDRVEEITDAVATYLRQRTDLGLTDLVLWASFGTRFELRQANDNQGANALVIFRIAYRARIGL